MEAKEWHNVPLITLLFSVLLRKQRPCCFECVCPSFFNWVRFFSFATGACLTADGKDATWLKYTIASCKSFVCEWCFYRDTPGSLGFNVAIWLQFCSSQPDTLDFPSLLFVLWFVSLRKHGRVSCGWSCNGTKVRLCWTNPVMFSNNKNS